MSYIEPKYKCDYCGKEFRAFGDTKVPPEELRIRVTIMGDQGRTTEAHYCGNSCLIDRVNLRRRDERIEGIY